VTQEALRRFRETATAWLPYIEWASIVAVGVKSPEGLVLLCGRIRLLRADAGHEAELHVETEHLVARRQFVHCSPETAAHLVDEAIQGRVAFENLSSVFFLRGATIGLHAYPIRPLGLTADVRLPTCRVTGGHKFAPLESIGGIEPADWELRGNDPPYHGLDDLMIALGLPTSGAMGDLAQLEVQVVPPAIIVGDLCAIRSGRADVRIWASPKLRREDVSVSVKGFPREGRPATARTLDFVRSVHAEGQTYDHLQFEGDAGDDSALRVFLRVNATAVNQFWIADPSRRLHASLVTAEVFDESLAALDQHLSNTRGDQAERFEWAVGDLLYLLGFRVLRLGKGTPITDGPDMLALTVSGHVAVVECTVGHPDNKDKVAKVLQRAARVRDKLNKSGFPETRVLPIIATQLPREELRDAHADSLRRGALIVDKEALTDLRQRVKFPQNSDQLFNEGVSAVSPRDGVQG
jgi:hypothetical protein